PWRFLYAHRDTPQWPVFLDILIEFNRGWAEKASALVFVVAQRSFTPPGKTEVTVNNSYAFDTGAATFSLALQASLSGWAAHIITGFDKVKGKKVLHIPENHDLLAAVVLGKQGQPESLPESLRTRETPTPRKPQSEWVAEGVFTFAG
ncbi:MAG: nitroreductase family protein, partial [Zoogloeaceae bacterium]|nr:nitroreductase family protein [Zoogloeaceae bacterium]